MEYNIRGSKIKITKAIESYIRTKLARIEKYLGDADDATIKVIVSPRGKDKKIEVTIWSGKYNIRSEEVHNDLYACIDLIVDKIERQFKKFKDKIIFQRTTAIYVEVDSDLEDELLDEDAEQIVRRKELFLKPMSEAEAILQMELLDHSFFVFKNDETNKINVLYKRKDGAYGLLETK